MNVRWQGSKVYEFRPQGLRRRKKEEGMLQEISAGWAAWAAACRTAKEFQTVARASGEKEA